MKDLKIAIVDGFCTNPGDIYWAPIEQLGEVTIFDRMVSAEVAERVGDVDVILTNKVVISAEVMDAIPSLKYIGVLATGTNVVDIKAATERGIVVTNIPAYSTDSVAQMVFALILAITNRPEYYSNLNHQGYWSRNADFCYWHNPLTELAGKQMGIVGYGNIGRKVAQIALAFGMRVAVATSKDQSALPEGIVKMERDELLATSDVVSLHCPLTDATFHMIGKEQLEEMKSTAILINTGRGPLIDEDALAAALRDGKIRAAGLDVMAKEPPEEDNPLLKLDNCVITPHVAWASYEARLRLIDIAAANLEAYLSGSPVNRVH